MNTRIKLIRNHPSVALSQDAFGKKLGLSGAAISRLESGDRNITDQNILAICREFKVSKEWLCTGEGEMFTELSRDEEIAAFIGEMANDADDSFRRRLISVLSRLSVDEWKLIEKMALELVEETKKD